MKQATVNPLADMGAQPATLQSGLTLATKSTDTVRPTVSVSSPAAGATVPVGVAVNVSGTATDSGGGVAGGVEASTDGGTTWPPATGRGSWSYSWTPVSPGSASIMVRATDDSANIGSTVTVPVTVGARTCPCSLWSPTAAPPGGPEPDAVGTELGTRFRSDVSGTVSGIRFYKQTGNTGTHLGHLWTTTGTPLATVTFAGETASGWQQAAASGATGVATTAPVSAKFSEPVQASTVQMQLTPTGGTAVSGSVSFASPGRSPVRRRPWSRRPSRRTRIAMTADEPAEPEPPPTD